MAPDMTTFIEVARAAALCLVATVVTNMRCRRYLDQKVSPPFLSFLGPTGRGRLSCGRPLPYPDELPAIMQRLVAVAGCFQPQLIAFFADVDHGDGSGHLIGIVLFREQEIAPVSMAAIYQQTSIGLLFSPPVPVDPLPLLFPILGVALAGMDPLQPSWPRDAWN